MKNKIALEESHSGMKATLIGSWDDNLLHLVIENNITELEINSGKGWRGENVDFLKYFPKLKSLILIDLSVRSIEGIYNLSELSKIRLITYAKTRVDFSLFPSLESCDFEWIKGSDSLFECAKLSGLGLNRYHSEDGKLFSNLNNLKFLTILNSPIKDLDGISPLLGLQHLSLTNLKNIVSLKGIDNLLNLEILEIQKCKGIRSVSEIFSLQKLRKLLLLDLGDINSFKGLERLQNLTTLMFYESTNIIDGDLSPIVRLKNLSDISFQNRKHYSHKREYFQQF